MIVMQFGLLIGRAKRRYAVIKLLDSDVILVLLLSFLEKKLYFLFVL